MGVVVDAVEDVVVAEVEAEVEEGERKENGNRRPNWVDW